MTRYFLFLFLPILGFGQTEFSLRVLGTIQDGGSPHIGCSQACCTHLNLEEKESRKVSCLAVVNHRTENYFIFDATPDFTEQIGLINSNKMPSGVFLTHAHIGHYTGLMYLGREAKGAKNVPVYAMPRLKSFLETNGPWSQLVSLNNIDLRPLQQNERMEIESGFFVTPLQVPHRDEFSETVGFIIELNSKRILFIPDIDKWGKWKTKIESLIPKVDLAFIDATFYDQKEVKRDMSEIPHPFVVESMKLLQSLSKRDKQKVNFIHLNHSNPLLDIKSEAYKSVIKKGFKVAQINDSYEF